MENDGEQTQKPKSSKKVKAEAREERLRAQLRANLSRRKAQSRVRGTGKTVEHK